ncbi:unnamed protein product [Cylicocyclus nassatus]|uniref:BTB domain-containing protein n=1 Tax=Cylicocyclus nassatus TaxID=53992 RepID=A0AA36DUA4_CYLNA|nr:unnamed protein product [Cylicocyclus nassatus]
MEDELARQAVERQLTDAIKSISKRLAQLYLDGDRLLRDAEGVPARYSEFAEELADERKKAAALLQLIPESQPLLEVLKTSFSTAQRMIQVLEKRANNWNAFMILKVETIFELNKLRKPLEEVMAKPRRSINDVKKDFDIISEERRKPSTMYDKVRKLQQLSELHEPLESPRADVRFFDAGAQQMEKEYDEALNEMSAEIEDENLFCDAIDHFNAEMKPICDLLSREPNQDNIRHVEKFQLPTLRTELAMLKKKYDEAYHARRYVNPDSSRIAAVEDRMKTLDSMLEDVKKAEQKRIMVMVTERLSQLKTIPVLEVTQDSLDEMENQLQNLPKDQADELQRQIENLRNAKKQHFNFIHGTVLTHVEDATTSFPTQDTPQQNYSRVKNSLKLIMDTTCLPASNCGRSLKVEVQLRDGPPGEALILTYSEAGYSAAKQNFCGFEWEAKPTIHEDHVAITLWCNPEVESHSWRCAALITVYSCADVDDETTLLYRSSHIFHNECRSTSIITPCVELDNDGTLGILNTSGVAAMPESNFTKPSEFSNACIAFKNSDMRVFVNKEYLLINSRKFATLFTPERSGSAASNDKSESGDDFDVLSSRASVPGQSLEDDSGLNTLLSSQAVCHEEGVFLLEDINIKDFITFLETIYPPFNDITGENVESVLPTAFRFDVEHIVKKCEIYLGSEDARKLFDLLQRLVFATTYKMDSLQEDSLASLQNARDVLSLLDDPRLQNVSSDLRSLLLETLLERFRSEAWTVTAEADGASTASDDF